MTDRKGIRQRQLSGCCSALIRFLLNARRWSQRANEFTSVLLRNINTSLFYVGMNVADSKSLKNLHVEDAKLKRLIADSELE